MAVAFAAALNEEMVRHVVSVIRRASKLGITHIETARLYSTADQFLFRALKRMSRAEQDQITLQNKVLPVENPQDFSALLDKTLKMVPNKRIKLLALHGINNHEHLMWALKPGGCCDVVDRFTEEGRFDTGFMFGLSSHAHTDVLLAAVRSGRFQYLNLHAHFLGGHTAVDNWPVVHEAHSRGMGVFIISPSHKGGFWYKPSATMTRLAHPLDPQTFHLLWLLTRPGVKVLSMGVETGDEMDAYYRAARLASAGPHAKRLADAIADNYRRHLAQVVGTEWQTSRWWLTVPGPEDQNHCHRMILPSILRVGILQRAYQMDEYATAYDANFSWPGNSWAAGNGVLHDAPLEDVEAAFAGFALGKQTAMDEFLHFRRLVAGFRASSPTGAGLDPMPMPCGARLPPAYVDRMGLALLRLVAVRIGGFFL